MNERILELAEQAGAKFGWAGGRDKVSMVLITEAEFEKFAELIIKECVLQCYHNGDMDRIENHFGVQ